MNEEWVMGKSRLRFFDLNDQYHSDEVCESRNVVEFVVIVAMLIEFINL